MIRHGEKPLSGNKLNEQGKNRSEMLVGYFKKDELVNRFGPPVAFYAAAPAKKKGSVRSIETVEPSAKALSLKVDKSYSKDDVSEIVDEIMHTRAYQGKTVVISWEHKMIPYLAEEFGATDAPDHWKSSNFNETWILTFSKKGKVSFTKEKQPKVPFDCIDIIKDKVTDVGTRIRRVFGL